jgi:hypothetical protein
LRADRERAGTTGVVRRVTAIPGARERAALGTERVVGFDQRDESTPSSIDWRTSAPTTAWASRNGMPFRDEELREIDRRAVGLSAAAVMRSPRYVLLASIPVIADRPSVIWSSASKNGSLSSCRSRLYASGKTLERRQQTRQVADQPAGLSSSEFGDVGFFFCGNIELPVL